MKLYLIFRGIVNNNSGHILNNSSYKESFVYIFIKNNKVLYDGFVSLLISGTSIPKTGTEVIGTSKKCGRYRRMSYITNGSIMAQRHQIQAAAVA